VERRCQETGLLSEEGEGSPLQPVARVLCRRGSPRSSRNELWVTANREGTKKHPLPSAEGRTHFSLYLLAGKASGPSMQQQEGRAKQPPQMMAFAFARLGSGYYLPVAD